jgi:hypothetical protein
MLNAEKGAETTDHSKSEIRAEIAKVAAKSRKDSEKEGFAAILARELGGG